MASLAEDVSSKRKQADGFLAATHVDRLTTTCACCMGVGARPYRWGVTPSPSTGASLLLADVARDDAAKRTGGAGRVSHRYGAAQTMQTLAPKLWSELVESSGFGVVS